MVYLQSVSVSVMEAPVKQAILQSLRLITQLWVGNNLSRQAETCQPAVSANNAQRLREHVCVFLCRKPVHAGELTDKLIYETVLYGYRQKKTLSRGFNFKHLSIYDHVKSKFPYRKLSRSYTSFAFDDRNCLLKFTRCAVTGTKILCVFLCVSASFFTQQGFTFLKLIAHLLKPLGKSPKKV